MWLFQLAQFSSVGKCYRNISKFLHTISRCSRSVRAQNILWHTSRIVVYCFFDIFVAVTNVVLKAIVNEV